MFDLSSGKLILIGVIALVVIGPKDLPGVLRQAGRMMAKLRDMAGEFRQQFDEAMREAELSEVTKTVDEAASMASSSVTSAFDPLTSAPNEIGHAINSIGHETSSMIESGAVITPAVASEPDMQSMLPPPPEPAPVVLPEADPKPRSRKKTATAEAGVTEIAAASEPVLAKPRAPRKKKTEKAEDEQA